MNIEPHGYTLTLDIGTEIFIDVSVEDHVNRVIRKGKRIFYKLEAVKGQPEIEVTDVFDCETEDHYVQSKWYEEVIAPLKPKRKGATKTAAKKQGKEKAYRLNAAECDVLTKIADRSKMDTWFMLNANGTAVRDLENKGRLIPLANGVRDLCEGMSGYRDYDLTKGEIIVFRALCRKLGVEPPPFTYVIFTVVAPFAPYVEIIEETKNKIMIRGVDFPNATRFRTREEAEDMLPRDKDGDIKGGFEVREV